MPDAAFLSPHAPEPCRRRPADGNGFALTMRDPEERWVGVNKAAPGPRRLSRRGTRQSRPRRRATGSGRLQPGDDAGASCRASARRAAAGILGYSGNSSGRSIWARRTARTAPGKTPPILLVHGDRDDVISAEALFLSAEFPGEGRNFPANGIFRPGLGHGIDGPGLMHGGPVRRQMLQAEARTGRQGAGAS